MDDRLINMVAEHEGYRAMPYLDTENVLTVGYGYNLEANPLRLSNAKLIEIHNHGLGQVEAKKYLVQILEQVEHELEAKLPWWSKLNAARQAVFIDMMYNLGPVRFLGSKLAGSKAKPLKSGFKNTLASAKANDFFGTANHMLNSKWSKDVNPKDRPDGRNYKLAEMMRSGRFPK